MEKFEDELRTGEVATTVPEVCTAVAEGMGEWKFSEPRHWTTPDQLVAEIRDTIDQLNDRPDSTARCLAAVDAFLAGPTEENRAAGPVRPGRPPRSHLRPKRVAAPGRLGLLGHNAPQGRNRTGRLLELVRSELHMRQAGIPGL